MSINTRHRDRQAFMRVCWQRVRERSSRGHTTGSRSGDDTSLSSLRAIRTIAIVRIAVSVMGFINPASSAPIRSRPASEPVQLERIPRSAPEQFATRVAVGVTRAKYTSLNVSSTRVTGMRVIRAPATRTVVNRSRPAANRTALGAATKLAEEVGFEPTVPLPVRRFSRPLP